MSFCRRSEQWDDVPASGTVAFVGNISRRQFWEPANLFIQYKQLGEVEIFDEAFVLGREALDFRLPGYPGGLSLSSTLYFISSHDTTSPGRRRISTKSLSSTEKRSTLARKDTLADHLV